MNTLNSGDVIELDGEHYTVSRDACNLTPYLKKVELPTAAGIYMTTIQPSWGLQRAVLDNRGDWYWLDLSHATLRPVDRDEFEKQYAHKLTIVHPYAEGTI